MRHRGEGAALWYRAFRYRWFERQIAGRSDVTRVLDLGCGGGENMWRFVDWSCAPVGLDVDAARLRTARGYGPVVQGAGQVLPFATGAFDMVYAAHVLHHVPDPVVLLSEARRCLRPGGVLFVVESVEDHPLLRIGRSLHPWWRGDRVQVRLHFAEMVALVQSAGLRVVNADRYSVLFWIWEVIPERVPWVDRITPLFTALEVVAQRLSRRWRAHGYVIAERLDR